MKVPGNRDEGLIFEPALHDAWDDERVSGPCILRSAEGPWMMWYYGRDRAFDPEINLPSGRCGLAISDDGMRWTRVPGPLTKGAVLEPHPEATRFDSSHVGVSDIHHRDGLYWMWYFGGDHGRTRIGTFDVKGLQLRPGCAISRDGLHWRRIEGPHRGALLDTGAPGQFDMALCGWPQVVACADGVWRLYYHTLDPSDMRFKVGLAQSADGLEWSKVGEIFGPGEPGSFDAFGVGTRHIIRHQDRYLMFYEGVSISGRHAIGLATSDDAIHWTRVPGRDAEGAIFAPAPSGSGRWDAFAVGTPRVVPMADGSFRLYYVGANETSEGFTSELALRHQIGLALSDGPDPTRWQRHGADDRGA